MRSPLEQGADVKKRGVTLVELVIVIAITGILATAFSGVFVPLVNGFFFYPQSSRVNNATANLLEIVIEGDDKAKGLRYAGPPCAPLLWITGTAYVVVVGGARCADYALTPRQLWL